MHGNHQKKLSVQIFRAIAQAFLLIAIVYIFFIVIFEKKRQKTIYTIIKVSVTTIVQQSYNDIANELFLHHSESLHYIAERILKTKGILCVAIYDGNNACVYSSDSSMSHDTLTTSRLLVDTSFEKRSWNKKNVLVYTKTIEVIDEKIGVITVYYSIDTILRDTHVSLLINCTLVVTLLLTTFGIFHLFLRKFILRPIYALNSAMHRIKTGEIEVQVRDISKNEIGEVSETFNQMSTENARMYKELNELNRLLEEKVKQRTADLEAAQKEMIYTAHKAGMADIATDILHNVGNVLNSINTSTEMVEKTLLDSKMEGLQKANQLLESHSHDLESFLVHDNKGKKLREYYMMVGNHLKEEHDVLMKHTLRLREKTKLIEAIISAQQAYASLSTTVETMNVQAVIKDALCLSDLSLQKHGILVKDNSSSTHTIIAQKMKLIHVFVNIFKNAKESMTQVSFDHRILTIESQEKNGTVTIAVSDSGHGFPSDIKEKIFNHGFTTKPQGHGFGLHSCANYVSEMGGKMWAESEGEGKGAVFYLQFKALNSVKPDEQPFSM